MKRALLIAGGTLGGLGAVMAITPPQLGSNQALDLGSAATTSTPAAAVAKSAPAVATTQATAQATATSKSAATKKATVTQSAAAQATAAASASASATATTATSAPAAAPAAPAAKGVTGTFVGPTVNVNYGNVQVQISVKDGKITDAKALQSPNGRSQRWSDMAIPILRQQTLTAQSDAIQGASGASYTSYGWFKSLQGALAKAGM